MSSASPHAQSIHKWFQQSIQEVSVEEANVIIVIGGDGFMLQTLRKFYGSPHLFFGIHAGTVGFLMNQWTEDPSNLIERVQNASVSFLAPLKIQATDLEGATQVHYAINEAVLNRATPQTSHIEIKIQNVIRCPHLIGDGVLVTTPAGSTAYNRSAHGPIIPIGAPLLGLTPLNPYAPRWWKGALLPEAVSIDLTVLNFRTRLTSLTTDNLEIACVQHVQIHRDSYQYKLLFDPGHHLEERIICQQFE
jgi:NAD+ kinase